MRKLKLQVQMSVDGYIAGPNGEMDFTVWNWDDELNNMSPISPDRWTASFLGENWPRGSSPTGLAWLQTRITRSL